MARGKYIIIEGNDGTGKSTQVELLKQRLEGTGRETVVVEEPGSDDPSKSVPIADELRTIIKNGSLQRSAETNLLLFSAARRELYQQKIAPALARGAFVLSARSYLSTLAYQGKGEGLDEELIMSTTRKFVGEDYMNPDTQLILTIDDEVERAKRIASRGELANPDTFEAQNSDFQARVNQAYIDIARERNIMTIDAGRSIDEIQADIRQLIGLA